MTRRISPTEEEVSVRLLTVEEVSKQLAISGAQVRKLIKIGAIAHVRFGRSIRIRQEVVERFAHQGWQAGA